MAKQPAKGRKTPAKPRASKAKAPNAEVATPEEATIVEADSIDAPAVDAEVIDVQDQKDADLKDVATGTDLTEPLNDPAPAPVAEQTKQRSGLVPMVFGGLIAGAIGYGAAYLTQPRIDPLLESKVSDQAKTIADLQDQVSAIPLVDPARFEEAATDREALSGRIDDLDARLAGLLTQPAGDGSLSAANIAAYQQELESLRASVEDLRGTAVAELKAARATAASIEENAEAAARKAAGRAALARVQGAIETGAPMGAPLDELADALQAEVPVGLTAVRDGAPTLAVLQSDFPDAARAALNTARTEGVSGEAIGGLTAFLRNQFSVRSTAPQEGDTADAVLSRAQAAVNTGRLGDALSEIATLPEVARAPLSDWAQRAQIRVDAMAAAATLTEQLNAN